MHTIFSAVSLRALARALAFTAMLVFTASQAFAGAGPTISGTPAASVKVNAWYSFRPGYDDPDTERNKLRFTIANKPSWATFSIYSGRLEGLPKAAGVWGNIRITVSDGAQTASLAPFSITASATGDGGGSGGGGSNSAPTISGSPSTSAPPGAPYSFTPSAQDANGDALTFSITNRPAWASFNTSTGRLSGTPTASNVGTYSSIRITVSDGRGGTASLPSFAITVSEVASGAATVSWTPPTRNTNGTSLTNLAGYRIYYGTSASSLNRTVQISNAGVATYVVENLSPATWYFSVRAYNTSGTESASSNIASKVVR